MSMLILVYRVFYVFLIGKIPLGIMFCRKLSFIKISCCYFLCENFGIRNHDLMLTAIVFNPGPSDPNQSFKK